MSIRNCRHSNLSGTCGKQFAIFWNFQCFPVYRSRVDLIFHSPSPSLLRWNSFWNGSGWVSYRFYIKKEDWIKICFYETIIVYKFYDKSSTVWLVEKAWKKKQLLKLYIIEDWNFHAKHLYNLYFSYWSTVKLTEFAEEKRNSIDFTTS